MSIQQDINSALGQVGILASINPSLQQKARDREEVNKIKKEDEVLDDRHKILTEEISKTNKASLNTLRDMKNMPPEERKSKAKEFKEINKKALSLGKEIDEITEIKDELTRRGYSVSPYEFKDRYFDLLKRDVNAELAVDANKRAEQTKREKAMLKEERKQFMRNLYQGVSRTLPGFKDMSREQQESIVKKMSPSDRRKTANEEAWRNDIYGK